MNGLWVAHPKIWLCVVSYHHALGRGNMLSICRWGKGWRTPVKGLEVQSLLWQLRLQAYQRGPLCVAPALFNAAMQLLIDMEPSQCCQNIPETAPRGLQGGSTIWTLLKRHSPRRKILPKPKKMEENSLITRFYHSRNYEAIFWSVINLSLLCREARIARAVQISWPPKSSMQCSCCLFKIKIIVVCSSSSNLTENKLAAIGLYTRVCPRRHVREI